jgi:hypothetical protein
MESQMSMSELLAELATVDEVSATIPTAFDGDQGRVPQWCELLLEVRRVDDGTLKPSWPLNVRMPLRRADGELIASVLNDVLHPQSSSAVEAVWVELDEVVERIQRRVDHGKEPLKRDVGQALGLATALAHLLNCEVDDVRAEAMERWESSH